MGGWVGLGVGIADSFEDMEGFEDAVEGSGDSTAEGSACGKAEGFEDIVEIKVDKEKL